ncbi:helix-turn-helix transcriptional regulator [Pantoea sp. CCBC3-3-1]|uniref:helix-turn-helix domain-containing protein n=1 Tax=Pantoea sp. CCBC3-3-1 TaxID=2490851 RepID=UPI0011BE56B4|nr:helix-turn-helix transcriptional regulator [Pantoea sp. CCBC3-3-1]
MSSVQYVYNDSGERTAAIVPIALYERMVEETELDEFFEPIPYVAGPNDDETIPHEVIEIMIDGSISLQAAWRVHRKMSQLDVAKALGVNQSAISNMEKRTKPQAGTLEKLAKLYDCRVTQLTLD